MSSRPASSGAQRLQAGSRGANSTRANENPIPSGSLRFAPVDERTKERVTLTFVTVFLSLCFAIPMVLAGIMMGSR